MPSVFNWEDYKAYMKREVMKKGPQFDQWAGEQGAYYRPINETKQAYLKAHPDHAVALEAHGMANRDLHRKLYSDIEAAMPLPRNPGLKSQGTPQSPGEHSERHPYGLDDEVRRTNRAYTGGRSFGDDFVAHQAEQIQMRGGRLSDALSKFRALGPVAVIQDAVGYAANKSEAEAKLTEMLAKDGMPKLSKEAVAEYGDIVAKLRLEQGVTLGVSEAMGFSNFMDWAKKNNMPIEALEKLNPTSKTKAQIEEALAVRGALMAQAEPEVKLAKAPDVRPQTDRGIA